MEILPRSTIGVDVSHGVSLLTHDIVIFQKEDEIQYGGKVYDGWYISYNNHDYDTYGCDTTAIVLGQMQKFFILNGDHCEKLLDAVKVKDPLESALAYFKSCKDEVSKFSGDICEEAIEGLYLSER